MANTRRLLDAGGFELGNLSKGRQEALILLSFHESHVVAAVVELMGAARDAEARQCQSLGAVW